jgi:endo-1,4-beta-mannosidase
MGWWRDFDRSEVATDFARIAGAGLDSVRLFLTWEDFQPKRTEVDPGMLERLVTVADLARQNRLEIVPTLFTGHMSGVNWVPEWALARSRPHNRFRVMSGDTLLNVGLRNWYADEEIAVAQATLASEASAALAGHGALWAWDLGNENSNCVVPTSRSSARTWLTRMALAIRGADPTALITVGLHMEDLEEDRRLGPQEATEVCDFLSMHGYPIYAPWADGPTDEQLLPFLALITHWLGRGRDVVFSEFGLPTYRGSDERGALERDQAAFPLIEETAAAAYTERALTALRAVGCAGAMLWCYADYDRAVWGKPPFDVAVHERSFGLWRADGSPKPALAAIQAFVGATRLEARNDHGWVDIHPDRFYAQPTLHLPRLYRRYRQSREPHRSSP